MFLLSFLVIIYFGPEVVVAVVGGWYDRWLEFWVVEILGGWDGRWVRWRDW
jgi:hypothetical protein